MTIRSLLCIFLALFLLALLESTNFIRVANIEPNLILVAFILISSFERRWRWRFVILLFSLISVAIGMDWSLELLYFSLVLLLSVFILDYLPWYVFINILATVLVGTLFFNFLLNLSDWNFNIYNLIFESVYNILVAGSFFVVVFIFWPTMYEKIN